MTATAAQASVAQVFAARARIRPGHRALTFAAHAQTYAELVDRVRRTAGLLRARGIGEGDRVAILSHNRPEYVEALLACAWLGAIAACQNHRLTTGELDHCLDLVEPARILASPDLATRLASRGEPVHLFGEPWEAALAHATPVDAPVDLDPEAPLLILYTSGTTGLPKAAVLSHRAELARDLVVRSELPLLAGDAFVGWTPLYHMGGVDYTLGTLLSGGTVHLVDGFDVERLGHLVATESIGWLLLMPGMVSRFADHLEAEGITPHGVRLCGVMADLVPPHEIARVTRLLDAPYANSFGATETGNPPASAGLIPVGEAPDSLPKVQSGACAIRLVDADDRDVEDGEPGELLIRGPTLFSGYFRDPDATAEAFRGGWFHMGDVFRRLDDGTLEFVDRRKYLIKSGGENIYPAEIERVLLQDPRVAEATVVRRPDERWGEVPVAFVARTDESLTADALVQACREHLASYKKPKDVVFIDFDDFPRSASGKVQRHALERRLETR